MKEIVIIEDSKLHQQKIKDAVSELNYKVAGVFSYGEKAVDYIFKKDSHPDLIIIDIILEGKMDGYQVAKKISSKTRIPFIFLSGRTENIKEFEASVYLNKPFNKQELKNNIKLALYKYDIYKKIIKSNEEKEMILDTTDTQIWYLKDPATFGKVNQAHAEFIGCDKTEIIDKMVTEFLPEKEASKCITSNKKVFEEKKKIQIEKWFENANGEKRLLKITKNPKLNKKGEVDYVVCSAEDITDSKKIEKRIKDLHKTAINFKELENEKEICEMTIKAAEELLEFNLCNVLLVKEEKFVPIASSSDYKQEERSVSDKSIAAKTYNKGKSFIIDDLENNRKAVAVENIYKSAISIPIEEYGVFQAAASEKNHFTENDLELAEILISHTKAALDRVYAQEKIKEQKNHLDTILNTIPEIIILLDEEGNYLNILTSNSADLIDNKDKLIGKNVKDVLPENVADEYLKYCKKVNQEGKVKNFDYKLNINGKEKYFDVIFAPIDFKDKLGKFIVATIRNITERKEKEKQIKHLSFHDEMTGLYNRRYFENELKRLDSSRKYPIAIVIGDLDDLKEVNDNYGHKKGDQYIIKAANILKSTARAEDIVARIGGDEFAVVLPNTNHQEAKSFCNRIRKNIENFNKDKDFVKPLSISLGFDVMEDSSQSLNKVFNKADQKMYINKGRK